MDITALKIRDARKMLDGREVSAPELAKAYLDRIAETDGKIKSYITVTADSAMKMAENDNK